MRNPFVKKHRCHQPKISTYRREYDECGNEMIILDDGTVLCSIHLDEDDDYNDDDLFGDDEFYNDDEDDDEFVPYNPNFILKPEIKEAHNNLPEEYRLDYKPSIKDIKNMDEETARFHLLRELTYAVISSNTKINDHENRLSRLENIVLGR